eukprot:364253-Chlamydomonas_euryale.AAC.6
MLVFAALANDLADHLESGMPDSLPAYDAMAWVVLVAPFCMCGHAQVGVTMATYPLMPPHLQLLSRQPQVLCCTRVQLAKLAIVASPQVKDRGRPCSPLRAASGGGSITIGARPWLLWAGPRSDSPGRSCGSGGLPQP